MELMYPKLSSGLKKMYASWWLALLGGIVGIIISIISAVTLTGESLFATMATSVVEIVVYALQVAGLYQAGKEENRYKKVFFMLVTELIIAVVLLVAVFTEAFLLIALVGVIGGLACAVLEPLRLCLFVKITEELVQQNGDAGVAGYYKAIRNCFFFCYGGILIGGIITGLEVVEWLGVLLVVAAVLCSLAVCFLYVFFLHNANKFFKTLEKPKNAEQWEESNSDYINFQ